MPKGFIDHASISSALSSLRVGNADELSQWDRQCLVEGTYLLLFDEVGIVRGPDIFHGATGYFHALVEKLPFLVRELAPDSQATAITKAWLTRHSGDLSALWQSAITPGDFERWSHLLINHYLEEHVIMHDGLFNVAFIPHIARVLNVSPRDLEIIHQAGRDRAVARSWKQAPNATEGARLAIQSYLLGILIRGKFHEYYAQSHGLSLYSHPFRKVIQRRLKPGAPQEVLLSEQCFVRLVIGSALRETSAKRRIERWADNISRARRALAANARAFHWSALQSDAEECAINFARRCGVSTTYQRIHRELDVAISLGISVLGVLISPWNLLIGLGPASYRYLKGESLGDTMAKAALDRKSGFRKVLRETPGRIESTFIVPHDQV